MAKILSFSLFLAFIITPLKAQHCGFDHLHHEHLKDPSNNKKEAAMNQRILERAQKRASGNQKTNMTVYTIPTVVHIVHSSGTPIGTAENLTDEEIIEVINETNERFKHLSGETFDNPYSGTDVGIQLCLAGTDPSGNGTNGIIRHEDDANCYNEYGTRNTQLAHFWPTNKYLNLYIVKGICDPGDCPNSNGIAGFSTLASAHGQNYDGAVFRYSSFWDGLMMHELGHYFGLYHTFQGGCVNNDCQADGDRVCDTPPKASSGGIGAGCTNSDNCTADTDDNSANNPFRAVASGGLGNQNDGNENYMDYSGGCWKAFTQGQKDRMRDAVETSRASLLTSNGCTIQRSLDVTLSIINNEPNVLCNTTYTPNITIRNTGSTTLTKATFTVKVDNSVMDTYVWTGSLAYNQSDTFDLNAITPAANSSILTITASAPNDGTDEGSENNEKSLSFFQAPQNYTIELDFEDYVLEPSGFSVYNPDGDNGAWYLTTSASGFGSGNASIAINNYSYNLSGTIDRYMAPVLDLSSATSANISFDLAYAQYSDNDYDGLYVKYSTDCGANWSQLWYQNATTLATAANATSFFYPASNEWKTINVNLSSALGNEKVLLAFENEGGNGNRIIVDNIEINVSSPVTSIDDQIEHIKVQPNPFNDIIMIQNPENAPTHYILQPIVGNTTVLSGQSSKALISLNTHQLPPGVYILHLSSNDRIKAYKLIKQ